MKLKYTIFLLFFTSVIPALHAQTEVRFGNEESDTTVINKLLDSREASQNFVNPEARVAFFARAFEGTPYAAHTLEGDDEVLTVRLDSLDCTTFVETAMALAYTSLENRKSWRDFIYNLKRMRYRGGEVNGYPSRLHYVSDWIVDNRYRGNFTDVTDQFPKVSYKVRSLDFMTTNRNLYPALAQKENYARMHDIENGYRQHRFPYIKTRDIGQKDVQGAFHNGDVVVLVTNLNNLDVSHMGIIFKETPTSEAYLLHASSSNGKVEITQLPLAEFMKKNRQWIGLRIIRLTHN